MGAAIQSASAISFREIRSNSAFLTASVYIGTVSSVKVAPGAIVLQVIL